MFDALPVPALRLFQSLIAVLVAFGLFMFAGGSSARHTGVCRVQAAVTAAESGLSGLAAARQLASCVVSQNSWLDNWVARDSRAALAAMPNAPCRYVGQWVSIRPESSYLITLKSNGEFRAEPLADSAGQGSFAGNWGEYKGKLIWLPENQPMWPIDANPIKQAPRPDAFSVVERNGELTHFFLAKKLYDDVCKA